eukprot:5674641-Pyramimonas_sp.AAC.1
MALRVHRASRRLTPGVITLGSCGTGTGNIQACIGMVCGFYKALWAWLWECTGLHGDGIGTIQGCIGLELGLHRA